MFTASDKLCDRLNFDYRRQLDINQDFSALDGIVDSITRGLDSIELLHEDFGSTKDHDVIRSYSRNNVLTNTLRKAVTEPVAWGTQPENMRLFLDYQFDIGQEALIFDKMLACLIEDHVINPAEFVIQNKEVGFDEALLHLILLNDPGAASKILQYTNWRTAYGWKSINSIMDLISILLVNRKLSGISEYVTEKSATDGTLMLNGDPVDYHIYSSPLSPNTVAVRFSYGDMVSIMVDFYSYTGRKGEFSETVIADIVLSNLLV